MAAELVEVGEGRELLGESLLARSRLLASLGTGLVIFGARLAGASIAEASPAPHCSGYDVCQCCSGSDCCACNGPLNYCNYNQCWYVCVEHRLWRCCDWAGGSGPCTCSTSTGGTC
jgi:hypothetical protein